jgi:hypothetical protein
MRCLRRGVGWSPCRLPCRPMGSGGGATSARSGKEEGGEFSKGQSFRRDRQTCCENGLSDLKWSEGTSAACCIQTESNTLHRWVRSKR